MAGKIGKFVKKWGILITFFFAAASWAWQIDTRIAGLQTLDSAESKFMPRAELSLRFYVVHYQAYHNCLKLKSIQDILRVDNKGDSCAEILTALTEGP